MTGFGERYAASGDHSVSRMIPVAVTMLSNLRVIEIIVAPPQHPRLIIKAGF